MTMSQVARADERATSAQESHGATQLWIRVPDKAENAADKPQEANQLRKEVTQRKMTSAIPHTFDHMAELVSIAWGLLNGGAVLLIASLLSRWKGVKAMAKRAVSLIVACALVLCGTPRALADEVYDGFGNDDPGTFGETPSSPDATEEVPEDETTWWFLDADQRNDSEDPAYDAGDQYLAESALCDGDDAAVGTGEDEKPSVVDVDEDLLQGVENGEAAFLGQGEEPTNRVADQDESGSSEGDAQPADVASDLTEWTVLPEWAEGWGLEDEEDPDSNVKEYDLAIDSNGGTIATSRYGSSTTCILPLRFGHSDNCDISWLSPKREGYVFTGWYTLEADGTMVYDAEGRCQWGQYWQPGYADEPGIYVCPRSIVVYAHWEPEDAAPAGEDGVERSVDPAVVDSEADDAAANAKSGKPSKRTSPRATASPKVVFDPNCDDAVGTMEGLSIGADGSCVIPGCAYYRELFSFREWNTRPDGLGATLNEGMTLDADSDIFDGGETVRLYALWSANPLHITVPVAIHYVAHSDGSVVGPADEVVYLQNLGETCVKVIGAKVDSAASRTLVPEGDVRNDEDWSMGLRFGQGDRIDFTALDGASAKGRLEWMDPGASIYLNDLTGQVGSADASDTYIGCLHWHFAAAKRSER
jgi:hypothetical protein